MKGFKNVDVYVEGKGIIKTSLGVEDGKIVYIGKDDENIEPYFEAENITVVPGFIDQHIHGAAGCDAMDGSVEALASIADALASEGTTGFLATTMTQSIPNIMKAMDAVKSYKQLSRVKGAEVIGVHLEGPFISPDYIGAQPLEYVIKPNIELFDQFNEACGNCVKLISMAPEVEGAEEFVKHAVSCGTVVSIGHSGAGYKVVEKAAEWGASNITHTYNAQKGVHHREIGVAGSAMLIDSYNCELICDTIHVSVPAIKLVIKNKPHGRITLITDAMRAKHMPDGESERGGQTVYVKNG
ncbi:MAG: N-acetylglucosamine-6-phosphate deacetylase, partial [Clostridia bacterium]|nr:N-acetylglucosamine-6-phosphate deacetylase [Clostridia bacterium]